LSPRRRRPATALALALLLAGLAGCGLRPAPIPESDSELGTRPGLLSGPSGEFVVYRQ
jgi:hypothetical protein